MKMFINKEKRNDMKKIKRIIAIKNCLDCPNSEYGVCKKGVGCNIVCGCKDKSIKSFEYIMKHNYIPIWCPLMTFSDFLTEFA